MRPVSAIASFLTINIILGIDKTDSIIMLIHADYYDIANTPGTEVVLSKQLPLTI